MTLLLIFAGILLVVGLMVACLIYLSVSLGKRALRISQAVQAKVSCPRCACARPTIRKPTSWRQALWGGWTCPQCQLEMDQKGVPLIDV